MENTNMAENIVELLTDVADAIREKKGSQDKINAQNFADEIKNLPSGSAPRYTGHADVEGLKAIGWDDDDIAYYQQYGVNWNEEDDQYHLVSDDNKALYGVLTASNYKSYSSRIVYMPKIDGIGSGSMAFNNFQALVALPLKLQGSTTFFYCFNGCKSLACCPPLDFSSTTNCDEMFSGTTTLQYIPTLSLIKATSISSMFNSSNYKGSVNIYAPNVITVGNLFRGCTSISSINLHVKVAPFDETSFHGNYSLRELHITADSVTLIGEYVFSNAISLSRPYIQSLASSVSFAFSPLIEKDALLYIINNAIPPTEGITIKLHKSAFERLGNDADIVAAIEGKNISIISA